MNVITINRRDFTEIGFEMAMKRRDDETVIDHAHRVAHLLGVGCVTSQPLTWNKPIVEPPMNAREDAKAGRTPVFYVMRFKPDFSHEIPVPIAYESGREYVYDEFMAEFSDHDTANWAALSFCGNTRWFSVALFVVRIR